MKTSLLSLALIVATSSAVCQDAAKPVKTNHLPLLMDRTDLALAISDATLRSFDVVTSYSEFKNPCHCYYERDPISPVGLGGLIAFHAGAFVLGQAARYELERHHHRKLAKLVALDVVSEGWAVENNVSIENAWRKSYDANGKLLPIPQAQPLQR